VHGIAAAPAAVARAIMIARTDVDQPPGINLFAPEGRRNVATGDVPMRNVTRG